MPETVKKHAPALIAALGLSGAGVTGYKSLDNDVAVLLNTVATHSDLKQIQTTVDDQTREIDTLYKKAELALKRAEELQSEISFLKGELSCRKLTSDTKQK